jgi:tetratricopeptide (TPR) repeat protein
MSGFEFDHNEIDRRLKLTHCRLTHLVLQKMRSFRQSARLPMIRARCSLGARNLQLHNSAHRSSSSAALILEQERHISELQGSLREAISLGKWETAASLSVECLNATEDHFSKNHTAYASALNNRGLVLKNQGKEEEALECYQQAFKLYSKLVGQDHTSTAAALCNLGLCNVAMASRESGVRRLELSEVATRCLSDAVEIRARVLGPNNWLTHQASVHLASALRVGRQFQKAERVLVDAITALRQSAGDKHPVTATAINNLGLLLKQMGELERAASAYMEAWALRKELLGERHPDTIATQYNLAELARASGDEARAAALQKEILRLLEETRPGD